MFGGGCVCIFLSSPLSLIIVWQGFNGGGVNISLYSFMRQVTVLQGCGGSDTDSIGSVARLLLV